jgi:hypothetical protein
MTIRSHYVTTLTDGIEADTPASRYVCSGHDTGRSESCGPHKSGAASYSLLGALLLNYLVTLTCRMCRVPSD